MLTERELSTDDWARLLAEELSAPVVVAYSRSRTKPIQAERLAHGMWWVRLHGLFRAAPEEVVADLARWLRVGRRARKASERLDAWLDERLRQLPPVPRRRAVLRPRGRTYDLQELVRSVYAGPWLPELSDAERRPGLTWGRRGRRRIRHSLTLGSYSPDTNVVRVHPVLDQAGVPDWFVRAVLFHELLHAAIPASRDQGNRRIVHGPEFRRRESRYPDHSRAQRWQERHLDRLIRSARSGRPLSRRSRLVGFVQGLLFDA